jgi:hypothetical protein
MSWCTDRGGLRPWQTVTFRKSGQLKELWFQFKRMLSYPGTVNEPSASFASPAARAHRESSNQFEVVGTRYRSKSGIPLNIAAWRTVVNVLHISIKNYKPAQIVIWL